METVVAASTHNHCPSLSLAKCQKYLPAQHPFLFHELHQNYLLGHCLSWIPKPVVLDSICPCSACEQYLVKLIYRNWFRYFESRVSGLDSANDWKSDSVLPAVVKLKEYNPAAVAGCLCINCIERTWRGTCRGEGRTCWGEGKLEEKQLRNWDRPILLIQFEHFHLALPVLNGTFGLFSYMTHFCCCSLKEVLS